MVDFIIEVSQVEAVGDIIFVYFTEILVPFTAEEPGDPWVRIITIAGWRLEVIHRGAQDAVELLWFQSWLGAIKISADRRSATEDLLASPLWYEWPVPSM
jgi:hypothetical protein